MTKLFQLVVACALLGIGVALLLETALGSDGYSTLVNGLSLSTGQPFWVVNLLVGVLLILMAWSRGTVPGVGTVVQPVVVGLVVSWVMLLIPTIEGPALRSGVLLVAFALLALGVAGYLASNTGAGPAEAAAIAWDPPMPFRWSYSIVQGGGALVGWLLGAAIGPATLVVILLLGPAVDLLRRTFPIMERVR